MVNVDDMSKESLQKYFQRKFNAEIKEEKTKFCIITHEDDEVEEGQVGFYLEYDTGDINLNVKNSDGLSSIIGYFDAGDKQFHLVAGVNHKFGLSLDDNKRIIVCED